MDSHRSFEDATCTTADLLVAAAVLLGPLPSLVPPASLLPPSPSLPVVVVVPVASSPSALGWASCTR